MPIHVPSMSDIPYLPLDVSKDVWRIVIDPIQNAPTSTHTRTQERMRWLMDHCPGCVQEEARLNFMTHQKVIEVDFSSDDLELYKSTFELPNGRSAVAGEKCLVLPYADYVHEVSHLARQRFGTDHPDQVKILRMPYELSPTQQQSNWVEHWRLLRRWRDVNGHTTPYTALDLEDKVALLELNRRLLEIEQWCYQEVLNLRGFNQVPTGSNKDGTPHMELQRRKGPSPLFLDDYFQLTTVWVEVRFVLKEKDPEYDENADSYLWEFIRPVHGLQFDQRRRWHTGGTSSREADEGCYLFAKLHAYLGMDWRDMLRIGDIYVDVKYSGTHVSASLSRSDCLAYEPLTPYLFKETQHHGVSRQLRYEGLCGGSFLQDDDVATRGCVHDLSEEETAHCERLNAELISIDFHTDTVTQFIHARLTQRVDDVNDPLEDFEVEVYLDHWLHPQDKIAQARSDRLFMRQNIHFSGDPKQSLEKTDDWEYDWCDWSHNKMPFRHGPSFHDLYDHHHLSLKDLPRIDRVCSNIEVWLQRFFTV